MIGQGPHLTSIQTQSHSLLLSLGEGGSLGLTCKETNSFNSVLYCGSVSADWPQSFSFVRWTFASPVSWHHYIFFVIVLALCSLSGNARKWGDSLKGALEDSLCSLWTSYFLTIKLFPTLICQICHLKSYCVQQVQLYQAVEGKETAHWLVHVTPQTHMIY